jgi:hypothetical protein
MEEIKNIIIILWRGLKEWNEFEYKSTIAIKITTMVGGG